MNQKRTLFREPIYPHDGEGDHLNRKKSQARSERLLRWCILTALLLYYGYYIGYRFCPQRTSIDLDAMKTPVYSYIEHNMSQPRMQYEHCASTEFSREHSFGFNISASNPVWLLSDYSAADTRKFLRGSIVVERGSQLQDSDVVVHARVRSNDEADLENLVFYDLQTGLDIEYNSTTKTVADLCTEVEIVVSLRPNLTRAIHLFAVRSHVLDIWFREGLAWKVDHLITHTSYGETTMMAFRPYPNRMIADKVTLSSTHGLIFGQLIPPENLEIRNEAGEIGLYIFPNMFYPAEPFDMHNISLSTTSGPITAMSIFDMPWPEKDYAHALRMSTDSGTIRAQAPHGSYTNYTSVSGDISCYLRSHGTNSSDTKSEIYTSSQSGNLDVRVSEAFQLGHGRHDPLHHTVSDHRVAEGELKLTYGDDWYGEIEAESDQGAVRFSGSNLTRIEKGEGYVKAKRGRRGKSRIDAHVGKGDIEIRIGM